MKAKTELACSKRLGANGGHVWFFFYFGFHLIDGNVNYNQKIAISSPMKPQKRHIQAVFFLLV